MTEQMLENVIKRINQQDKPVPTLENMRTLYLQRLGVSANDGPSFDLLQRLQRAHVERRQVSVRLTAPPYMQSASSGPR